MKENSFSNRKLEINQLPLYQEVKLIPLSKKYLLISYFNIGVSFLIFSIILIALYYYVTPFPLNLFYFMLGVLTLFLLFRFIAIRLTFKNRGYAIREHDIIFKSGILEEITTIVPINKIQHLVYEQGFLEKKLGLARLECFTAGGEDADIILYGLKEKEIKKIQSYIQHIIS